MTKRIRPHGKAAPNSHRVMANLTKREWFAAHTLSGMLASEHYAGRTCQQLADEAIACADALLSKLEETEDGV